MRYSSKRFKVAEDGKCNLLYACQKTTQQEHKNV